MFLTLGDQETSEEEEQGLHYDLVMLNCDAAAAAHKSTSPCCKAARQTLQVNLIYREEAFMYPVFYIFNISMCFLSSDDCKLLAHVLRINHVQSKYYCGGKVITDTRSLFNNEDVDDISNSPVK